MLGQRDETPVSAWPALPPHVQVTDLRRELAFYLALGYYVQSAADGWALLSCGEKSFVLVHGSLPAASYLPPPTHLTIVDPAAVAVGPGPSVVSAS